MNNVVPILLVVLLYLIPVVLGFIILFYVVRGAILSALRRHVAETHPPAPRAGSAGTHLNADGI